MFFLSNPTRRRVGSSSLPHGHAVALERDDIAVSHLELADLCADHAAQIKRLALDGARPVVVEADKSVAGIALVAALRALERTVMIVSAGLGREVRSRIAAIAGARVEMSVENGTVSARDIVPPGSAAPEAAGIGESRRGAAIILTTSGSTGLPKGVRLSSAAVGAFFKWARQAFDLREGIRVLSFAPLNFDLSLLEVWATLEAGGTVVLADPDLAADAPRLASLVTRSRPHVLQGVPLLYKALTADPVSVYRDVRHVIVTGETAPPDLRRRMAGCFPLARFHNVYGSTETNDSFRFSCDPQTFATVERLPIGTPLPGCAHRIVDANGREVTAGGEGELHTSTPFMADGYTDPELSAGGFYEHGTVSAPRRYYRTGDMVRRARDGSIHLVGRRDNIVKVRGVRTNLLDVETTLETHRGVQAAVVCPIAEGDRDIRLHAVIEARTDGVSPLDLRRHCAALLPRSAIPKQFTLVDQPLPRTSTGKPDRNRVSALFTRKEL